MRKIVVHALALALSVLLWSPAAQAVPSPADIPDLSELRLYFLHLANLDAAADKADAEGTAADTAGWRSFEQNRAGLTEIEGAILKDVAYRCNQALEDHAAALQAGTVEGPDLKAIVSGAADELETALGPEAFESLARRIHDLIGPATVSVPAAAASSSSEDDELPVELEPLAVGPSINVTTLTFKLPDGTFTAECITSPNDSETIRLYAGGTIHSCLLYGGNGPTGEPVPCPATGNSCIATYPKAPPGEARHTQATHGLRLKYSNTCLGQFFGGLEDPLHYCRNGMLPPHYFETGDVPPLGGAGQCWDGYPQIQSCVIATSVSSQVVFFDIVPREATVPAGGQKKFRGILDMLATWSVVSGPGTIDSTGLYKAPATVAGEQTATIKGCDAYAPGDCTTATVKVVPLSVSVSPASVAELLPSAQQSFTATVTPSGTGLAVEWLLIDASNAASITPTGTGATAVFKAPANDRFGDDLVITVKACVKPAPESPPVCGTAQVTVPKMLFYITGSKKALAPDETVQLTAFVFGSSVPREINWQPLPAGTGTLTPVIPDPYVVVYKAPTFPEGSGVDVKACLKDSPELCATYRIDFVQPVKITSVTSDTGKWNAGTMTPFTITGTGFGSSPAVRFSSLQPTVTLASDTKIQGQVRIPIAMGGKTTQPSVLVTYPNGDTFEAFSSAIAIAPASLSVLPATAELRAGESRQFSAVCLTASAEACTSLETPSWSATAGAIDASGRYTAPASVASSTTATINACWGAGVCAAAQVTLLAQGVTVSPKTVSLQPGKTQQFTAQVTGTTNTAVTWSIAPATTGSITSTGLYTAPATFGGAATVTVTATSQADATKKDTATVTLVPTPLTVTSTASRAATYYGQALTWTATASGGIPGTYQYALFRRKSGTATWIPALESPVWQTSNLLSWTPASADVGIWDIRVGARDASTSSPVLHDPGPVQVVPPLTFTCPTIPPYVYPGTAVTFTITASGGTGVGRQYAVFRRRAGTTAWTPDVTAPAWQSSNVFSWLPGATDVGTWELYIWVRDSATPPNQNGYGYFVGCNPGTVQVLAPVSLVTTASPAASYYGRAIAWTATANGNAPASTQYALFRKKTGTTTWIPALTAPAWQTGNALSWTPVSTDVGAWEIWVWVRDGNTPATLNTYGYAASSNPGQVNVVPPMSLTGTLSPASATAGTALTWTATASGGTGVGRQYAFFRRRTGTTPWTPDVTNPAWQTSNVLTWTPGATDVGTWETYIWVKDSATPPTMNTYGHAAWYNAGNVQIVAPLGLTCSASPAASYSGQAINWTATATGGVPASTQFALFRRKVGTTTWTPAVTAPAWQTANKLSWTPASTNLGAWEFWIWVRDGNTPTTLNTYGYAASCSPGQTNVVTPMSLTGTVSPAGSYTGQTLTWTATASGGSGTGRQYAFFRRRAGTTPWTPDVTNPAWQTSNVLRWTPGAADVGTWETYIWARDSATPPTMNTYGHAAWYNSGTVQIVAPLGVTSTASPALATHGNTLTWTATATGGVPASTQFAIVRRKTGTTAWTSASWQTSNVLSWTPGSSEVATWEISIRVRDGYTPPSMNGSGYAASYNPGSVQVVAPLAVTGTGSPAAVYHGNPITWTATGSGGTGVGRQYAFFRRKAGTSRWTPDVTAPAWQTGNVMGWTPASSDVGTWEIVIWFKDANTAPNANGYGFGAYYNAGPVQVFAHPTVTGTGSPASAVYGTTLTWTATASGGTGSARQYALFRRKAGTTTWIPALTSPGWQSSNTMSWTPASTDVGTWEIFVWLKDADTPPTMNGYGFAAYYNAGPVQVTSP